MFTQNIHTPESKCDHTYQGYVSVSLLPQGVYFTLNMVKKTLSAHSIKSAKDFKKDMQEMCDDPDSGFTSVSMLIGGKDYIPIATKSQTPSKMSKVETLSLKCVLTDEEMLAISKDLSEHLNKKKAAEDDLASFSAQKKAEIKGHEAIINKSAMLINSGSEYRNIKCEVVIEPAKDTVSWIRQDTGDLAQQERPIPQRYLQAELDIF